MYKKIKFPYGNTSKFIKSDLKGKIDIYLPKQLAQTSYSTNEIIDNAILSYNPQKLKLSEEKTVAIAINDPTRPIPHHLLIPPLLNWLHDNGILDENITFFIATGTHKNLSAKEISDYLPDIVYKKYRTCVHDCNDRENLIYLGLSPAKVPVYVNKKYYEQEIKIVVGHIEPHHFMGYSGGVKSAVIGLGGRETITTNHKMLINPQCKMGNFHNNPMRIDLEEIGKIIGVDIALNVVLDDKKEIHSVFFGEPYSVMEEGIKVSENICQVNSNLNYDLVICSAGGYPKDINLYQSQKAITHACTFLKEEGIVILIAECIEGIGSVGFESFFDNKSSPEEVINTFENSPFIIGPHKAYQLSIQRKKHKLILVSNLDYDLARKLFLIPAKNLEMAINIAHDYIPENPNIALLPYATHIINNKNTADNEQE